MNQPSHEDLLGYVLGALDAAEQNQVQQWIDAYPEAEDQLLAIKASIGPLEYIDAPAGPPPGLARRTCQAIAVVERTLPRAVEQSDHPGTQFPLTQAVARRALSERRQNAVALPQHWGGNQLATPRRLSLMDVAFACSAALIVGSLLMPALAVVRFNGRLTHCQDNLRQVFMGLSAFSQDHDGRYLVVPRSGRLNMVGVFAPILVESEYVEHSRVFHCPGLGEDCDRSEIPNIREIENIPCPLEFAARSRRMCGDYAINLGYFDEGDQYVGPCQHGFGSRLLLADVSSCTGIAGMSGNHQRRRINGVLGNGAILCLRSAVIGSDAIYFSDRNQVEPGLNPLDTVLGCGNTRLPTGCWP
ncbi:MAG TPA: hypothetical protein PKD54_13130 [Pirellulaceae bacterium]|nr:hypothetical protein [Pirellulaceae bacterium]